MRDWPAALGVGTASSPVQVGCNRKAGWSREFRADLTGGRAVPTPIESSWELQPMQVKRIAMNQAKSKTIREQPCP